jgi:WD40 repeat protein
MSVRPSPDGLRLITIPSYAGKSVPPGLWDLEHYRLIASLEGHVGRVFSARFAGNSEIVTAGGDGAVRRWDGATGQLRQIYRGSSRFLADAMLYPDGSMVVAGGGDGLLRFWDASSGRLLWTVQAHKSFVIGIHFEGDDIVTRGFGGDVARWTLPTLDSVIEACTACDIGTSQREFGIVQP